MKDQIKHWIDIAKLWIDQNVPLYTKAWADAMRGDLHTAERRRDELSCLLEREQLARNNAVTAEREATERMEDAIVHSQRTGEFFERTLDPHGQAYVAALSDQIIKALPPKPVIEWRSQNEIVHATFEKRFLFRWDIAPGNFGVAFDMLQLEQAGEPLHLVEHSIRRYFRANVYPKIEADMIASIRRRGN